MSLLEDVLHVLRMILEYFGAPPEMLVPVWDCELCGQYRSIVRMIGTNLPLEPPPRVHFQIPLLSYKPHVDVTVDTPTIPSFADILWVCEDEGNSSTRTRNHLLLNKHNTVNKNVSKAQRPMLHQSQRGFNSVKPTPGPDALKKISALETELLKLRAQIALIVTAPPTPALECASMLSPPSPPALTSTPLRPPAPMPPPPPPPPPPFCPSTSAPVQSVSELIKSRKQNHEKHPQNTQDSTAVEGKGQPSMLDVLKDLNQVKLRSVQRSPGGTPVRKRRSRGAALHSDPAALIAEALKRKFAHHHHNNSSDKENSRELSPFSSPDTPKFSHQRRSQGRRYQ